MTTDTTEPLSAAAGTHDALSLPPPRLRRELRQLAGSTQEDIALQFGVSDGAVSYWERRSPGRRHKRGYLALLIRWADEARAMGFPINWPGCGTTSGLPK